MLVARAKLLLLIMLKPLAYTSVVKFWELEGPPVPLWWVCAFPISNPLVVWPLFLSSCLLFISHQALF